MMLTHRGGARLSEPFQSWNVIIMISEAEYAAYNTLTTL